jgi:hypothetical protein
MWVDYIMLGNPLANVLRGRIARDGLIGQPPSAIVVVCDVSPRALRDRECEACRHATVAFLSVGLIQISAGHWLCGPISKSLRYSRRRSKNSFNASSSPQAGPDFGQLPQSVCLELFVHLRFPPEAPIGLPRAPNDDPSSPRPSETHSIDGKDHRGRTGLPENAIVGTHRPSAG